MKQVSKLFDKFMRFLLNGFLPFSFVVLFSLLMEYVVVTYQLSADAVNVIDRARCNKSFVEIYKNVSGMASLMIVVFVVSRKVRFSLLESKGIIMEVPFEDKKVFYFVENEEVSLCNGKRVQYLRI